MMKTMIMALVMLGLALSGAEAQTRSGYECKPVKKTAVVKKKVHARTVRTARTTAKKQYQVCREEGGYYTCCLYSNKTATKTWE